MSLPDPNRGGSRDLVDVPAGARREVGGPSRSAAGSDSDSDQHGGICEDGARQSGLGSEGAFCPLSDDNVDGIAFRTRLHHVVHPCATP